MTKKVLSIALISTILLFSGCGESDSEGESRLETQQMLDSGNFAGVISRIESKTSKTVGDYLALGAAYIGKAGLSFSDLVEVVAASNEDSSSDGFASFINNIDNRKSPSALKDLEKSAQNYKKVVKTACADAIADPNLVLTDTQRDICLYIGLSYSMKTATAFGYLGDVAKLAESGSSDDKLKASACAMGYAYDGTYDNTNCAIIDNNSTITFVDSNKTYNEFNVTVNSNSFEYLMTTTGTPKQIALTDGYCTLTDFSTRVEEKFAGSYVCPVNEEKGTDDLTAASILVDTLNTGVDSIVAAAGSDGSDMSDDIKEFKEEIKGSSDDGNITLSEIIAYIDKKNK